MKLSTLIEAFGLGAAGDAKRLVARLPGAGMRVAASDEAVVRALSRARHERVALADGHAAAALSLGLGADEDGLVRVEALCAATSEGGIVIVCETQSLGGSADRARTAGLFLRAGLVALAQETDGSTVFTSGRVRRPLVG